MMGQMLGGLGSTFASLLFVWAMFQKYFPYQLQVWIERYFQKFVSFFNPYVEVTFHEYSGNRLRRNEAYTVVEQYLSSKSTDQATRLKADAVKDPRAIVLSLDDHEEVCDEYQGVKLFWSKIKTIPKTQTISFYPGPSDKRYYKVSFHRRYRKFITSYYLQYVMTEGKAIGARNRQRKLYTNSSDGVYKYSNTEWSHVAFEHPASFETLAIDPIKKKEIIDDLETFSKSKEYYARIGKAWKRGYLLYGPPGTGKSTMIAAIANFMNYDIYDLELTAVKDNTVLRKLLIETSSKSIIVIEDIDCSLDLTGQRKKKSKKDGKKKAKKDGAKDEKDPIKQEEEEEEEEEGEQNKSSRVTLSGLLNVIDGIWSSNGGERLIIFTTNYVEKLDEALIRRGRMDKHIELSFCDFEGFKVLAKNYLSIESHELFDTIKTLLEETKMTPADVAENLMPKSIKGDPETCLESLVQALKTAKEEARVNAEEEERLKVGKDAKEEESTVEAKTEDKEPAAKENEEESSAEEVSQLGERVSVKSPYV